MASKRVTGPLERTDVRFQARKAEDDGNFEKESKMKLNELNFTGTELVTKKSEVERTSVLHKLNSVYDENAKLVFLFDVSGSMSSCVAKSYTEQYAWTPELMADIRQKIAAVLADPLSVVLGSDLLMLCDPPASPFDPPTIPSDDTELQERIVRKNLIGELNIPVDFTKQHEQPPTRISLVKKLAKSELENRFKKYPKSRIAIIPFGGHAPVLFDDGTPDQLWPTLETLQIGMVVNGKSTNSGDTRILDAIKSGMEVCRKKPSAVGIHHFIVVTDGGDRVANENIVSWVPALKASGIVLDYIHIGDEHVNEGIKKACELLGGEAVTVNSVRDFEQRFVEAVGRKMLPAGK